LFLWQGWDTTKLNHRCFEKEQQITMAHSPAMPSPVALPGVSKIVAIGSGKGGVGKTTVAVNLAVALSRLGQRVGLIDADIYGPNVPLMMGSTQQPKVGPDNRIEPNLTHGIKTISIGYISPGDKPMVMRGPMLHQIIRQFIQQVEWGELDYLIVDLPQAPATWSSPWSRLCR
jgi:ATP-binding protein involved in chromosome partitioning